jgi:predicted nucleic acid-binding protein
MEAKSSILQLTREIALKSGKLKSALRKLSKNISLADSIHFQTAKDFGAVFVTGDPDFKPIKQGKDVVFL